MKKFIPYLALAGFCCSVLLSSCDKKQETPAVTTPQPVAVGTSVHYAYPLPAASGQFLFSNPDACTLQVLINGQSVHNFTKSDIPLKVTTRGTSPDSLYFDTRQPSELDVRVGFGIVQPTGFQSFYITNNDATNRQEGGIGTVDLRDVLVYVVNVHSCQMNLNWDADSLYMSTTTEECICVKGGNIENGAKLKLGSIPACDF